MSTLEKSASTGRHVNLSCDVLLAAAVKRGEGVLTYNGALAVTTGDRTGRSPKDRYIVQDSSINELVHWGDVNVAIDPQYFTGLWASAEAYLADRESFVGYLAVGADPRYAIKVKVTTEYASHQLFAKHLFIDSMNDILEDQSIWQIINVPGMPTDPSRDHTNSDAAVLIHLASKRVLLCGMRYAGEMKKAMFAVQNFLLPQKDILPMHCSANASAKESGDVALFFGLSGTGKTTLSADPKRFLIGDDEHAWAKDGVFNLEGGCYAKCINLSEENEPLIYKALRAPAMLENVMLDPDTKKPIFSDDSLTQNTRGAYPLSHIDQRVPSNKGKTPKAVIFLTCDLYGVLPPVACLDTAQAAYYFLSGYTALVGSTEVGSTAVVKPTFSCCFGAPFFPLNPKVYADLLMKRISESSCPVYLVNTGWTGGAYGEGGTRFSIPVTRQIVDAILDGSIESSPMMAMPGFGFNVPTKLGDISSDILLPFSKGMQNGAYVALHRQLIEQFQDNFKQFDVSDVVRLAGPQLPVEKE